MFRKILFRKTLSILAYVVMALIVAWLIVDRYPPTLKLGHNAPVNESITLLSGHKSTFKSLLKKPMLINFWAPWCSSCLKEMPVLSKISQKYALDIIFVGAAIKSNKADILSIKQRYGLDYQQALVSDAVVEIWQAQVVPTTYLLNKSGQILWAKAGMVNEDELEKAIALLLKR